MDWYGCMVKHQALRPRLVKTSDMVRWIFYFLDPDHPNLRSVSLQPGKLLALPPGKRVRFTVCTVSQYGHLNTSTRRTVGPSQGGWDSAKRKLQNDTWHLFFWEGTDFSSQWDRWNKSPATTWRSLVKVSFNWACLKTCQGFQPSQMDMNMNPAMSSIRIYGFVIVYTPLCLLVN